MSIYNNNKKNTTYLCARIVVNDVGYAINRLGKIYEINLIDKKINDMHVLIKIPYAFKILFKHVNRNCNKYFELKTSYQLNCMWTFIRKSINPIYCYF